MSGSDRPAREAEVRELRRSLRTLIAKESTSPEGLTFLRGLKILLLEEFSPPAADGEPPEVVEWKQTRMGIVGTQHPISEIPGGRGLWLRTRFRLACLALGEYGRPRTSLRELRERSW